TALEELRGKSRERHDRLRFRHGGDGTLPRPLRFCDHGNWHADAVDEAVKALGLRVLRTPVRAPQANAYCERLVGTIRRECLDFMIPFGEKHLRRILRDWIRHYNSGRPHSSLGPGLPIPDLELPRSPQPNRHQLPQGWNILAKSVLGGCTTNTDWK